MTIQYLKLEKTKYAIIKLNGAETLLEYLEDLEDSLIALQRVSEASNKSLIKHDQVKTLLLDNKIKELRLKKGLSQKELAKKLSTSQAFISKLENPKYRPSLKMLSKVAAAIKSNIEELI